MPISRSKMTLCGTCERGARGVIALALALEATSLPARADLAIETETARLLPAKRFEAGAAFEFQTDPDGSHEYAAPMALEYGVSKRLEALIEPVPYTSIRPSDSASATGFGDVEATLTYLARPETRSHPAFAVAGEIKFPTAHNVQIGTGKRDYRLYAVASKRVGNVDLHANLGYNIIGAPTGVQTRNPFDVEFAAEWFVTPKFDLFGEVTHVGSSLASAGASTGGGGVNSLAQASAQVSAAASGGTPDVAGQETVGSVGVRTHLSPRTDLFGSFSYDSSKAKLFRTGFNLKF